LADDDPGGRSLQKSAAPRRPGTFHEKAEHGRGGADIAADRKGGLLPGCEVWGRLRAMIGFMDGEAS